MYNKLFKNNVLCIQRVIPLLTTRGQALPSNGAAVCDGAAEGDAGAAEHAVWQPGGFLSTLKMLVISGCQTEAVQS